MSVSRFRLLVFLWIVAYGWVVSLPVGHDKQPSYVAQALQFSQRGAMLPLPASAEFLLLFAGIVSALGLVFFSRIARGVFTLFTVTAIALKLFGGVSVMPPFESMLLSITMLLQGVVLGAAFSSPLRERFEVSEEIDGSDAPPVEEEEGEVEAEAEEELVELLETSSADVATAIASRLAAADIEFTTAGVDSVRFLVLEGDLPRAKIAIQEEIIN